jgi:hypothetical protein
MWRERVRDGAQSSLTAVLREVRDACFKIRTNVVRILEVPFIEDQTDQTRV